MCSCKSNKNPIHRIDGGVTPLESFSRLHHNAIDFTTTTEGDIRAAGEVHLMTEENEDGSSFFIRRERERERERGNERQLRKMTEGETNYRSLVRAGRHRE